MTDIPDPEFDGYEPWGDDWSAGVGDVDIPPEDMDLEPVTLGTIEIAPGVFATISVEAGTVFDPAEVDLSGVEDLLGIDRDDFEPLDIADVPPDFDYDDPDVRGPFHDEESLRNFLDDTGLDEFGDAFYDSEADVYYFVITGTE